MSLQIPIVCPMLAVRSRTCMSTALEDPLSRSEEADPPANRVCMNWLSEAPKTWRRLRGPGTQDSRVTNDSTRMMTAPNQDGY